MRKEIRRKFLCFFTFCWMLLAFIPNVYAAKLTRGNASQLYNGSDTGKKLDGKKAYCTTRSWNVPSAGATYEIVAGTNNYNRDNLVAGQIIRIGKKKYSGNTEYENIQEALTCYFKGKASVNKYNINDSFCSKSAIKSLISTAKNYVGEYQFNEGSKTSSLPKLDIISTSQVISNVSHQTGSGYTYRSVTDGNGNITIQGMESTNYGGNRSGYYSSTVPKYTLNITSSAPGSAAYLCLNNNDSQCYASGATNLVNGTYSLKVVNGGNAGGTVSVSIVGENSSNYPSANIFECTKGCGKHPQLLQTEVSSVPVTRQVVANQNFTYSAEGKHSALIEKVDETGNALKNATLRLYIADANGKELKELCRTNSNGNDTSCTVNELTEDDNYKNGNKLCYEEVVSPSGYKNIGSDCETISLESNTTLYYEYHKSSNSDKWEKTPIENNGKQLFDNYTKFAKSDKVSTKNVFYVRNGKKVYTDAEKVYEYKYTVSGKEKVFYTTSNIPKESTKIYKHGNKTVDDDGTTKYEFEDPIYTIEVPKDMDATVDKSGIEKNLVKVDVYKKDGKYIVLSSTEDEDGVPVYSEKDPQEVVVKSKEYTSQVKVCYNTNDGVAADSDKYCSEDYYMTQVATANGNFHITVLNTLNSIKISKKAITGTDELPGATLALYTSENGKCTNNLVSKKNSSALVFSYRAYSPVTYVEDEKNTTEDSKTDTSGSTTEDSSDDNSSDTVVDNNYNYLDGLKWVSSDEPVTISGLAAGTYCLSETIPAAGYKKNTTTTKFTINDKGEIVDNIEGEHTGDSKNGILSNVTLVVRNELNKVTISKTDIVTSKEIPGAKLRICDAVKGDDGKYSAVVSTGETGDEVNDLSGCDTPILSDGSDASWESKDTPHEFSGLPSGTYALVEITAPNGYEVAETIFFKMNDNGVLTDVDGNPLSDNKIVMHDKPINDVKTGDKYIITIIVITLSCLIIGVGMYYYSNKNKFNGNGKIRKRKIYLNKLN